MQQQTKNFKIPALTPEEVARSMTDLGFGGITPEHLQNINPELACGLYEYFALILLQINESTWENELQQPAFDGLDALNGKDKEHLRDGIRTQNFMQNVSKIMRAAGVCDFSLKDIFRPNTKRTVFLLSALINFCRYRQDKIARISKPLDECDELVMRDAELDHEKEELERKIAMIQEERESKQPEIQALESEIKDLNQVICSLNKQQANMQTELKDITKRIVEYNDKISSANFTLNEIEQEASNQRSLIVQSPDKLQKTLEDKRSLNSELDASIESATEASQKWNVALAAYSKAHKKAAKSLRLIQKLQDQINSCKAVEKNVKGSKSKLKEAEKEDWSLEAQEAELKVKLGQLENTLKLIEAEKELKYKEADKELDCTKAKISPILKNLNQRRKGLAKKHREKECIQRRITEVSNEKESILWRLVNRQTTLIDKIRMYNSRISNSLKEADQLDF